MADGTDLIVSVSGIRGIVGSGLTPEVTTAFASALGTFTGGGRIVLGRDGRPSGNMIRHAVLAGLFSAGCDVVDLGIVPTPTCGLALVRLGASGGIQITASHNAAPWNGLKLFGPEGMVLPADQGQRIKELFALRTFRRAAWDRLGQMTEQQRAINWHLERVLQLVDPDKIGLGGLRVLVDGNGGAGGPLSRLLLEALKSDVVCHACTADGIFRHEPEPTEENVRTLGPMVVEREADIGFILDPDSDRLALLDEAGRYIGEELTLALAVWFRLQQERGPVVINMSSSRICEDIAGKFGCPCYRAAVGEANVVAKMRAIGAVIGGEGNGGVIDPRVGWVRDPFIGMALILNLLADTRKKLSELIAELPAYTIVKDKYPIERERLPGLFARLRSRWPEAKSREEDGLRLDWNDRWVHIRPSNTEPIMRVIAEAQGGEDAKQLCREVADMMEDS
jgi:phosphomannomutase